MRNLAVYIVMVFSLIACSDDDKVKSTDAELLGTWKLSQVYMDPGDGSGDFTSVDSEKTISFFSDGTLNSNTDLCFISSEIGQPSTGTFSETEMTITVLDCDVSPFEMNFEINNNNLIISYFCIEACQEKYVKL
ncbi:hypothetical protein [Psychroserpens luteus]|uniref:Lipocalin-like domain-containing protein n=1 Tax=Psychroserpens luteus TaxID=1434066 RepID=A0ABW5ZZ59_9FLAO|nr:hypothetical protein [Psychroserpens luteus]